MRKKVFFTTVGCLLLTFVLAGFVGCTKKETGSASAAAGADKGAALSATRTIVDHTGAEVVLPAQINRVVIVGPWPLASVYFLYTESSEKIYTVCYIIAVIKTDRNFPIGFYLIQILYKIHLL